jgi:pyruvate,water dikinase
MLMEFTDATATDAALSGGKGASLARLTQGGFAVPTGIIVGAGGYRAFLRGVAGLRERIAALDLNDPVALHAQCA